MADDITLPQSEALLTEVLGLLQTLSASVDTVKEEIRDITDEIKAINVRIDKIITDGFVDGNLVEHKRSHTKGLLGRLFS